MFINVFDCIVGQNELGGLKCIFSLVFVRSQHIQKKTLEKSQHRIKRMIKNEKATNACNHV